MPPRPTRLLLGELTDNQRAVVMTLMTGCCAVIGFMVQNKLDERWGGLQEVRTPPELSVASVRCVLMVCAPLQKQRLHNLAMKNIRNEELRQLNDESREDPCNRARSAS